MYREQRVVTRCRIEFERLGRRISAVSEDLSTAGVFVRTEDLFPVNAVVTLDIELPDATRLAVVSRVAHLLTPSAARALGREVGMGFQFLEFEGDARERLEGYLDLLIDEITPPPTAIGQGADILVADPSVPLLERLTTALTDAEFDVRAVTNGSDAYESIQSKPPQIVLLNDRLPGLDGWSLAKRIARRPYLSTIPVVMMSDDGSDMVRLQAYRLGIRDFIPRPFTDEELILRLRRIALDLHHQRTAVLRGTLSEISMATLLSILDFERKSGILMVLAARELARVFISAGRVLRVEGGGSDVPPRERLFDVLDWCDGSFEFAACEVDSDDRVGLPTQTLLLEHARLRDEASRDGQDGQDGQGGSGEVEIDFAVDTTDEGRGARDDAADLDDEVL